MKFLAVSKVLGEVLCTTDSPLPSDFTGELRNLTGGKLAKELLEYMEYLENKALTKLK